MLFSATFNKKMRKLAKKYLSADHVRIRIGRAGSTHINVQQNVGLLVLVPGFADVL
jgi:ATP-dependent RNA helicase DDX3X